MGLSIFNRAIQDMNIFQNIRHQSPQAATLISSVKEDMTLPLIKHHALVAQLVEDLSNAERSSTLDKESQTGGRTRDFFMQRKDRVCDEDVNKSPPNQARFPQLSVHAL